jgi:endonuclease YncB( thermonuclease family)
MSILLAASIVAAGQSFTCTPTHVWDGDGPVWCAEGPHVRISGIAAREMDGTCRTNQPCPDASPGEARDALVNLFGGARGRNSTGHVLVGGPALTCRSEGSAGGNRTAAWCNFPTGADLSCAMIATGTVLRWERYWKGPECL